MLVRDRWPHLRLCVDAKRSLSIWVARLEVRAFSDLSPDAWPLEVSLLGWSLFMLSSFLSPSSFSGRDRDEGVVFFAEHSVGKFFSDTFFTACVLCGPLSPVVDRFLSAVVGCSELFSPPDDRFNVWLLVLPT